MHLETLATFLAIVEEGSLVRAARRLHVSQSTVTTRLRSLEAEVGRPLINRSKSGATPTVAGYRLQRNAETMLELWTQVRRDAAQPDAVTDVCNVVCGPDLWLGLMANFVAVARKSSAYLALSVTHGSPERTAPLAEGVADVVISYEPPSVGSGVEIRHVGADKLVLVATQADAAVRFNPTYVLVDAGADFARWHDRTYADAGIARVHFGSSRLGLDHLLVSAQDGLGGSAYLPLRLVVDHVEAGLLHVLADGPTFDRDVYVAARSEAVQRWLWFDDAVADLAQGLVS